MQEELAHLEQLRSSFKESIRWKKTDSDHCSLTSDEDWRTFLILSFRVATLCKQAAHFAIN